jgi:hypothetical protein
LIDTREEDAGARRSKARALTIGGVFQKMEEGTKKDRVRARLLERHPHLREFFDHPDAETFSVKVESVQLLEGPTESYFERIE